MSGRPAPAWQKYRKGPDSTLAPAKSVGGQGKGGKSPYRLGREFEQAVRGRLQRRGYFVMRAAMSKGKIDLLAVGPACLEAGVTGLFIQCKRRGSISSEEWNTVFELAQQHGGMPMLCFKPSIKEVSFMRLDEPRAFGKPGRPWTPIDPADCSVIEEPLALPIPA